MMVKEDSSSQVGLCRYDLSREGDNALKEGEFYLRDCLEIWNLLLIVGGGV